MNLTRTITIKDTPEGGSMNDKSPAPKFRIEIVNKPGGHFWRVIYAENGKQHSRASETYRRKEPSRKGLYDFINAIVTGDYDIVGVKEAAAKPKVAGRMGRD